NEIDIEGLIATTSCWLPHTVYPEAIHDRVEAYNLIRPNLLQHANNWPTREYLISKIGGGQRDFGMKGVGLGKSTQGSEIIVNALEADDPRPVHFAINAGANTLSQALWDIRDRHDAEECARLIAKVRVYDDSGQDDGGAWMCHDFPDLFYVRSRCQIFGLYGPRIGAGPDAWAPLEEYDWVETNIRRRHSIMGALYPQRQHKDGQSDFMEGGGTGSWIGLINKGLYDPAQISWGGWGGRFSWEKKQVTAGQPKARPLEEKYFPFMMYGQDDDWSWTFDGPDEGWFGFSGYRDDGKMYNKEFHAIWRWRSAHLNEFKARMDWTVGDYERCFHNPVAAFYDDENRSIVHLEVEAGEKIVLDASKSWSPDRKLRYLEDNLSYEWFDYPEAAGTKERLSIDKADESIAEVIIPKDAAGKKFHVILQVCDNNPECPLTSYRRIVMDVQK
ncbi:MAG: DUF1593 domain-containing protein, partial [Planctomycetes bacterium]|nr:DUF1593 domain-containing protein [Planctomycetota bacterium]